MGFVQNLDNAASAAICSWLNEGGNAVLGSAVLAGLAVPGGQVPSLAAGLGVLALNYGCTLTRQKRHPQPWTPATAESRKGHRLTSTITVQTAVSRGGQEGISV